MYTSVSRRRVSLESHSGAVRADFESKQNSLQGLRQVPSWTRISGREPFHLKPTPALQDWF